MPIINIAGQRIPAHFQWDDVASTLAYAASSSLQLNLPTDGLITSVSAMLDPLQYDNSGTVAHNDDSALKALNGLAITVDGGRRPFGYTDARGIYYDNRFVYGNAGAIGSLATTTGTAKQARLNVTHHAGVQPYRHGTGRRACYDPADVSAGYDATLLSTHALVWTTPANTVMGTSITYQTTTTLKARVGRWLGVPVALARLVPTPKFTEELYTISATSTDLGTRYHLPTGVWVARTLIIQTDNGTAPADVRDDTRITQMGIIISKPQNSRPVSKTWREWRSDTVLNAGWAVDNGTAALNVVTSDLPYGGVVVIDWPLFTGSRYGLDMTQKQLGDIDLGLTVGTGNGTYKIYNMSYENVSPWYANQPYGAD